MKKISILIVDDESLGRERVRTFLEDEDDAEEIPVIIFITAHDEPAIEAFEVHAFDYLLKPFRKERFLETLGRARQFLQKRRVVDLQEELLSMLSQGGAKPGYLNRLTVKTANRIIFVKVEDVDWLESAGNYVEIHTGDKTYTIRETMTALEEKLAPERFLRISRSHIVNLDAIDELKPLFKGEYAVVLRGGTQLTLNRGLKELQKRLEVL